MTKRTFDDVLLNAIDESLTSLGESVKHSTYFHIEKKFSIPRKEIPRNLARFQEGLEKIFGTGARFIEILIMKKLHEKVDARFMWNESEEFGLVQYASEAKRVFQKKNVIKTVEELFECEETVAEL